MERYGRKMQNLGREYRQQYSWLVNIGWLVGDQLINFSFMNHMWYLYRFNFIINHLLPIGSACCIIWSSVRSHVGWCTMKVYLFVHSATRLQTAGTVSHLHSSLIGTRHSMIPSISLLEELIEPGGRENRSFTPNRPHGHVNSHDILSTNGIPSDTKK